jgi:L-lactate dehydrogenase complex protein LldG
VGDDARLRHHGDIEQTIVLGAHGPYRVHVIVVTGA